VRKNSPIDTYTNEKSPLLMKDHDVATKLEALPMDTFRALMDHLKRENEEKVCVDFFVKYEYTLLFQVLAILPPTATTTNQQRRRRENISHEQSMASSKVLTSAAMCAYTIVKNGQTTNEDRKKYMALAVQYFHTAVQITPSYSKGWMQLATLRDEQNLYDVSLQLYRRAFHSRWLSRYDLSLKNRLGIERARDVSRKKKKKILVIYCDEYVSSRKNKKM
jgi:hypothetical protein